MKMKNFMEQQLWLTKGRFVFGTENGECPLRNTSCNTPVIVQISMKAILYCCTWVTLDSRLNHFWKDPLLSAEKTFQRELLGNTNQS